METKLDFRSKMKPRLEPFALVVFWLAFFVMVAPLEADMLWSLVHYRRFAASVGCWLVCFLIVFIPFVFSWKRFRSHPTRWRGRGYLIATGLILTVNLTFGVVAFYHRASDTFP
jgi:hypothetical protein